MSATVYTTPPQMANRERRSLYASPVDRKAALRHALNEATDLQHHADPEALDNLTEMVERVDEIHLDWENSNPEERIENSDQVLIDSEVMTISSNIIKSCMNSMSKEMSAYKRSEFAEKLICFVRGLSDETNEEPNWRILERNILGLFKNTPHVSMLLSCINPVDKPVGTRKNETVAAQRRLNREKEAKVVLKKPETVTVLEKEESTVEQTVHQLAKKIRTLFIAADKQPINYFKLVINPHDFGKTIENILHTAFLARDGRLRMLRVEGEQDLYVIPTSVREKEEAESRGNNINIQNMISIDYEQWEQLVKHYNITEPTIDF